MEIFVIANAVVDDWSSTLYCQSVTITSAHMSGFSLSKSYLVSLQGKLNVPVLILPHGTVSSHLWQTKCKMNITTGVQTEYHAHINHQ